MGPGPHPMKTVVGQIVEDVTDGDGIPGSTWWSARAVTRTTSRGSRTPSGAASRSGRCGCRGPSTPPTSARGVSERPRARARSRWCWRCRGWAPPTAPWPWPGTRSPTRPPCAPCTRDFSACGSDGSFPPPRSRSGASRRGACPVSRSTSSGPSRKDSVIQEMEPDKGESYLQFLLSQAGSSSRRVRPFLEEWVMSARNYRRTFAHLDFTDRHRRALEKIGEGTEFRPGGEAREGGERHQPHADVRGGPGPPPLLGRRAVGDVDGGTRRPGVEGAAGRDHLLQGRPPCQPQRDPAGLRRRAPVGEILGDGVDPAHEEVAGHPRKPLLKALRQKSNRVVRSDRADVCRIRPASGASAATWRRRSPSEAPLTSRAVPIATSRSRAGLSSSPMSSGACGRRRGPLDATPFRVQPQLRV